MKAIYNGKLYTIGVAEWNYVILRGHGKVHVVKYGDVGLVLDPTDSEREEVEATNGKSSTGS